jgi:hypothetical protein
LKKGSTLSNAPQSRVQSTSTPIITQTDLSLSELGDSSSLFSYKTPDFEFTGKGIPFKNTYSPIPFVFGKSDKDSSPHKMVNERSPAKATLLPRVGNEQPTRQEETSYKLNATPSSVPQFGQPTMPHSPLHRPAPKDSGVFIQPKSRPEHHRDSDRPGMVLSHIQ